MNVRAYKPVETGCFAEVPVFNADEFAEGLHERSGKCRGPVRTQDMGNAKERKPSGEHM